MRESCPLGGIPFAFVFNVFTHNTISFLQVRARNEFIAGNWSDPLELNYTVPPIAVVTDGKK